MTPFAPDPDVVAWLRGYQKEQRDAQRARGLGDRCESESGHCACVPKLRARIAELERPPEVGKSRWGKTGARG